MLTKTSCLFYNSWESAWVDIVNEVIWAGSNHVDLICGIRADVLVNWAFLKNTSKVKRWFSNFCTIHSSLTRNIERCVCIEYSNKKRYVCMTCLRWLLKLEVSLNMMIGMNDDA